MRKRTIVKKKVHPNSLKNLIPLKKGYDPRRNTKGAPDTTAQIRKQIKELASMTTEVKGEGGKKVKLTLLENLLLDMLNSASAQDRQNILKAMYPGLLVDEVKDISTKRVIKVSIKKEE